MIGAMFRGLPRGIRAGVWWNVALLAGSLVALPFDHRIIFGLNPWIKPLKFEISVIVFLATVGLLLRVLEGGWAKPRTLQLLGWIFGFAMIVENSIIAMQSARGVPSHMNYTSVFNGIAFGIMGLFIALNTACLAILLVLFCTIRVPRPLAELWGIRAGLAMILVGSMEGFRIVVHGAHTVGAPDGGPGLPFLNWSTMHGDLRVAHFFALHALQVFWAAGWMLGRSSLTPWTGALAIVFFAVLYAGVDWLLFAQALAGRALLALQ